MSAGAGHFDLVTAQLVVDGAVVIIGPHGSRPLAGCLAHSGTETGDEGPMYLRGSLDLPSWVMTDPITGQALEKVSLVGLMGLAGGRARDQLRVHDVSPGGADPTKRLPSAEQNTNIESAGKLWKPGKTFHETAIGLKTRPYMRVMADLNEEERELDRQWREVFGQPLPMLGAGHIARMVLEQYRKDVVGHCGSNC